GGPGSTRCCTVDTNWSIKPGCFSLIELIRQKVRGLPCCFILRWHPNKAQPVIKRKAFIYPPIILYVPFEIEVFVVSSRMRRCLLVSIKGTRDRVSKWKLSIERITGIIGKAD